VAGFHGLAQGLQRRPRELRQFVEEQHAMVGQGDFAWPRRRAAVNYMKTCDWKLDIT
jgi:hypothetical protein